MTLLPPNGTPLSSKIALFRPKKRQKGIKKQAKIDYFLQVLSQIRSKSVIFQRLFDCFLSHNLFSLSHLTASICHLASSLFP
jgi:hypothetical protein